MEEKKLLKRREKALEANNEALLVSVCIDLANLYSDEGRYESAIKEYIMVANIYKRQNNHLKYAVANRGIGEAYVGLQKFDKALHHHNIYLTTVKEIGNKLEEQRALATLGHTHLSRSVDSPQSNQEDLITAYKFFKTSLAVAQSLHRQASKIEVADMSARLYCNLGLVQEYLKNFDKATELINKSINICRIHCLYEQLQRGYVVYASLLTKTGDYKSAIQQYNLAEAAARKLRRKPGILVGIYQNKSELLVKLGDLRGAKNTLHKAHKLNISDPKCRRTIEDNLRVVASMVQHEDKILKTESTNYQEQKKLYERMGDGCCELKHFDKAIEYYKKMLEVALEANSTDSELATCYYSLAETFGDNGQYGEAVDYYERELVLSVGLKDGLNTLSRIADTKEAADAPVADVRAVYDRAIDRCAKDGNKHEEGRMVKRCIAYLRRQKQHSEAFKLEQILAALNYQSSDSDSDGVEAPTGSGLGADIDLDALTDVSDDSDFDQPTKAKRCCKAYSVRKNVKGETQLHTACIKGELNVVKLLLERGHPVNVRDNCGWLPLHEACIHGHLEVVRLLLEKGAAINDRGGIKCEGITPLHDAAVNGHLSIVQLLLKKGANAVAKTDSGDTVLNYLQQWRATAGLHDEKQKLYESITEEIAEALEKSGYTIDERPSSESLRTTTPQKNMRRSTIVGLEDEENPTPHCSRDARRSYSLDDSFEHFDSHVNDYKDIMESLKRRNDTKVPPSSTTVAKRSALVSSEDVVDDWLEDDIGKNVKKRKTKSPIRFDNTHSPARSYKSNSPRKSNLPAKSHFSRRSDDDIIFCPDSPKDVHVLSDDDFVPSQTSSMSGTQNNKLTGYRRLRQTKLTHFDQSRTSTEPDSTCSPRKSDFVKCNSFDNPQPIMNPTISIDVRINKKLYRVPILLSQVNAHTIKWLADEAAARYAKKEYMIPTLELESKNGAILANEDPLSLLFPMGNTQTEEVEAKIIKWSVPALTDRYKEACQDMGMTPSDDICGILEEMSVNLNLSSKGLKGTSLAPLCKVLNRQVNLLEMDLSGNFLTDECFRFLGSSMPTLENLHRLNISCTGLRPEHMQILVNNLDPDVAYKVRDLDVSDNFLGDRSFESLALLTRRFRLKKLNLSGNNFTKDIFQRSCNQNVTLRLDEVEEFHISDNALENTALTRFLSWLHSRNLRTIDVSRNSVTPGFATDFLNAWTEANQLEICKFSRCHVVDADIFKLLQIAPSLKILDASYNNLTGIAFRRLFESQITTLDLYGCNDLFQYFTDFSKFLDQSSRDLNKGKTLKVTLPENRFEETEYLIRMWNDLYGSRTIVELGSRFLRLSVSK